MDVQGNFIGGEWVESTEVIENFNPSDTQDLIGRYASASVEQVGNAIAAARAALTGWAAATTQVRSDLLSKTAAEILARKDELGELVSREAGKTRAEGVGEVVRAAQVFQFFSGEAVRFAGENLPSVRPGITVQTNREPVGVVSLITPWNFPVAIPAWKMAPALAFGNTVVIKPSEHTPAIGCELVKILQRNGLPPGVLNLVNGDGARLGEALLDGVNAVSFTGSVATGRKVADGAIKRMVRMQLEMGGKNPLVVLDDADLEIAVECAANGAFFSAGQRCTASSRLIVTEGIHDRFVAALLDRMQSLRVGNALAPDTQIGPVINRSQLDRMLRFIEIGKDEGATLARGGSVLERETPGYFLDPALFVDSTNEMRINREEIFGPVASVIRVGNYEEALSVANDTDYGLSSGICTTSLKYANHFRAHVKSGLTMTNLPTAGLDYHVPFGGMKASSYGPREQGKYAVEFYTSLKTAYVGY